MTHVQIRDVPETTHRRLKAKAALEGSSLNDFLLRRLDEIASRPTLAEWLERIEREQEPYTGTPAATLIREDRDRR